MQNYVKVNNVSKTYHAGNKKKELKVLDQVSFVLEKGESLAIIGPSGCGKTSLLKIIMKLIKADSGKVDINGRLAFVAQDPFSSLDPTLTVGKIVAEPLIFTKIKKNYKEALEKVKKALEYVHLNPEVYIDRLPSQLSGGERQRVSIARALAIEPDLLIMDEPTSMLDQEVKWDIMDLIRKIVDKGTFSFIMVSHDISLCKSVCRHLIVMDKGRIIESGETDFIVADPKEELTKTLLEVSTNLRKYWDL